MAVPPLPSDDSAGNVWTAAKVNAVYDLLEYERDTDLTWASHTVGWTNLTVGDGNVNAEYLHEGYRCDYRGAFTMGSTSSFSGTISADLPVAASTVAGTLGNTGSFGPSAVGSVYILDVLARSYVGVCLLETTTTLKFYTDGGAAVSTTTPMTWAQGGGVSDVLVWQIVYETASRPA
jgi:hypothetical protein